jgi:alkyl hydroperoxide reductase subunit F
MYDSIIIGAGAAGLTAAIYAIRREMKILVISRDIGGQMLWTNEIENYPGFSSISGFELIEKMKKQATDFGVEIKESDVKKIELTPAGDFLLYTNLETFTAKTVIVTMGLSPRRLAVPGEVEFSGKGVTYCATCDGPFFKHKTVSVIGGGNSALDAAELLSKIADKVYLIHRGGEFKAFEALINQVQERSNVEILLNTEVKNILGSTKVEKIKVVNNLDKSEREIITDGVFVEAGRIASTDLVAELAERNSQNKIITGPKGETKTPGLFAAGDVTDCEFKQITIATGQGTIAALSAYQYLQLKNGKSAVITQDYNSSRKK